MYDALTETSELPVGWTDEQTNGVYRFRNRNDAVDFGWPVVPQSREEISLIMKLEIKNDPHREIHCEIPMKQSNRAYVCRSCSDTKSACIHSHFKVWGVYG